MTIPEISTDSLMIHACYSDNNSFVFQYIWLDELVKTHGKEAAKDIVKQHLPALLENTAKHYEYALPTSQNKQWYSDSLQLTKKAIEKYESGSGRIIVFYGDYQDKDRGRIFEFSKNSPA